MKTKLHYVGITHKQANATERALFALSGKEQETFRQNLMSKCQLHGLLLLFTCNRAEIYFESEKVSTAKVCKYFINFLKYLRPESPLHPHLIREEGDTLAIAHGLFLLANGLNSAIVGDRQIFGQLKAAYKMSLRNGHQGSLLERTMQYVFRSHKRVVNETRFFNNTESLASRTLDQVNMFCQPQQQDVKILLVGAGEMIQEVAPHIKKWRRADTYIANRTTIQAQRLAHLHQMKILDWGKVEANQIGKFDIVISAVSNCKNLISKLQETSRKQLFIDLAIPANINRNLRSDRVSIIDLDQLALQSNRLLENFRLGRTHAEQIIQEEMTLFMEWKYRQLNRNLCHH